MNLKRPCSKIIVGIFLSLLMALAYPISVEDTPKLVLKEKKDLVNYNWLSDIVGVPDKEQVEILTWHVADVMKEEQDRRCIAIDYNLRMLVFQNFVIYQHMSNKQDHYFKERMALKYAHVLAMILKESSGDPTNVTGMSGRSISTNRPNANLQRWKDLLKTTKQKGIKFNSQTNFGLTQLSIDRLYVVFKLAHGASHNQDFLEGKYGDATHNKRKLNTAIAIRRLIWFYQDIAQGRLTQEDKPIQQEDIYKNEFHERYQKGLKMALLYCGTGLLFNENNQYSWDNESPNVEQAIASIAYCKLGNSKTGYGKNKIDMRCFVEWVTLCPALNLNIALITPLSYFQTRKAKPVCIDTFRRLLNKKPKNH